MRPFTAFNPFTLTGQDRLIDTHGVNKGEQLVVYNYSSAILILHFLNFQAAYVPAYWAMDIIVPTIAMGRVPYDIVAVVPTSGDILPIVYGTLYEPGEHIPSFSMPIPASLPSALPGGNFYSAFVVLPSTGNPYQVINLFNPVLSNIKGLILGAVAYTSNSLYPIVNLVSSIGPDTLLHNPTGCVPHDITAKPVKSVMNCSYEDMPAPPGGTVLYSTFINDAQHFNLVNEKESFTLEPGANLMVQLDSIQVNDQVGLEFYWSEVPIIA